MHWLTPDLGRVATVAKGARRANSPFRGKLDLFYEADFSFSRSRRGDLHSLREVSLRQMHPRLRQDLAALQQAAYCTALLEQTTEAETPLPGIHAVFRALLAELTARPARPRTVLAFEAKLLVELGQQPDMTETRLSPAARELYASLEADDFPALATLTPRAEPARELHQFLHGFLIYHLGRIPPGRGEALLSA